MFQLHEKVRSQTIAGIFVDQPLQRCVFLDRDGVLNVRNKRGYVTRWEDFSFRDESLDALSLARSHGLGVVIVSNQRCVAKGIATPEDVRRVMTRMCQELDENETPIAAWFCCPHDVSDFCVCRKPMPGMLCAARDLLGVDLSRSYMVGDSESDVEAGRRAGCRLSLRIDENDTKGLTRALSLIIKDMHAQE